MTVSKLFLNGCSFLTFRPKQGVDTHCGVELAKKMDLEIAVNLAGGGRGNKRTSFTTKVWCEKYPDIAEKCFFLIGSSSGTTRGTNFQVWPPRGELTVQTRTLNVRLFGST